MIRVRPITPEDRQEWTRLWTRYLEFYETQLPADTYDVAFERLNSGQPGEFQGALAELDGKAVGLVHFVAHRDLWSVEDVIYLQDLYADEEIRGKGIGRALIEYVYAQADQAGTPSVYWLTQENNVTARRLYDRIGKLTPFVRYRRR